MSKFEKLTPVQIRLSDWFAANKFRTKWPLRVDGIQIRASQEEVVMSGCIHDLPKEQIEELLFLNGQWDDLERLAPERLNELTKKLMDETWDNAGGDSQPCKE